MKKSSSLHPILGQESWTLETPDVKAALTRQAGHLGPVSFRIGDRWVEPFAVAPWAQETLSPDTPQLLRVLRGDFFCMPFGINATPFQGEAHPPHGETANGVWTLEEAASHHLHLSMETTVRKGRVDKTISLVPGHSALYSRHVVSGMDGPMTFGHHAILRLAEGSVGHISTSPFTYGQVSPKPFEDPAKGGYSILKPGAEFTTLQRVPQTDGQCADLSVYPAREGYEDLVLMGSDTTLPFAWTALVVAEENYVWFALKDPRVLRSTVFWMSNGGRHYAPWNGRHRRTIGLEEVTTYFDYGLAESAADNPLQRAGVQTSVHLDSRHPSTVNYVVAVAAIPPGFDRVQRIEGAADSQSVILTAESGQTINVPLDLSFLTGR